MVHTCLPSRSRASTRRHAAKETDNLPVRAAGRWSEEREGVLSGIRQAGPGRRGVGLGGCRGQERRRRAGWTGGEGQEAAEETGRSWRSRSWGGC